jgi:hypothetical protein
MAAKSLTIEQMLIELEVAPGRIAALTSELRAAQLRTAPGADEWSANDVLAHLRACADMWGDAIMAIVVEDHPTIRAVNPRTWIKQTDYPELEFAPSLRAFTTQRAELLIALKPLPPEGWSRSATVTGAGRPLVRTVRDYAARLVRHERPHLKQIARIAETMRV